MEVVGRACRAQPEGVSHTAGYARVLSVCKVGTPLIHNGMDALLNLCVTEWTLAWQYVVTGDGRRQR